MGPQGRSGRGRKITEIRTQYCPARSESLYRLSHRGPRITTVPCTILYLSLIKTKTVVCLSVALLSENS